VRFSVIDTAGTAFEHRIRAPLDQSALQEMRELRVKTGLDLCGEQGEYHTMVVAGPPFQQRILLGPYEVRTCGGMTHLDGEAASESHSVSDPA
jgi:diphthamide synthase (EF-2-diphthine--ammonia ligase)